MKKSVLILICVLYGCFFASAQYRSATEAEKNAIVEGMKKAAEGMNALQCDFVQVKELSFMDDKVTSEGKMFFKKPDRIRWEYVKPYKYVMTMDGKNVRMTSGDKTNTVPMRSSKLFGEISRIMVGGVSGQGLVDSQDFSAAFMVSSASGEVKIALTPLKKEVKDLFSAINLYVGKADSRIRSVELVEKSGDKTVITLKNVQLNTDINDEIFTK